MDHRIQLLHTVQLAPDTRQYVFTRPHDYEFVPGQATELALDESGWRDEGRPFTFTGDPDADVLVFTIKSYFDHDGVTRKLWSLAPGAQVTIGDPWGAFKPEGSGVFLAGGAGITPFIGILDHLQRTCDIKGSLLIFANSSHRDIILRAYFEGMDGLETRFITDDGENADRAGRLDGEAIDAFVTDFDQRFYVCGPPPMEEGVLEHLRGKGVSDDHILTEE